MTRSFIAATSVQEALDAIGAGARPVAGGTDLVVGARQGKAPLPDDIVAIDRIDELRGVSETDGGLHLGALATHAQLVADPVVRARFTAVADASAIVGSHATRANGTVGGNVMNGSPAMDTGGPLLCFGASASLASASGVRTVGLDELWLGPGTTSALPGELLLGVDLPILADGTGSAYVRLEYRRHMEIAVVGVTAVVTLDAGTVVDARIAITALAPTIRRVPEAEQALVGGGGDEVGVSSAAAATAAGATPISDVRGSAAYRTAMAEVIARRAITAALARARGQDVPVPASQAVFGA